MTFSAALRKQVLMGASSLLIWAVAFEVYRLFHKYDWGFPFVKLFCFLTMGFLIAYLASRATKESPSPQLHAAEIVVFGGILCALILIYGTRYGPEVLAPPRGDIATTTIRSAEMLFREHANPYSSELINPRSELKPEHRGFHYGPLMLFAYWPSAIWKAPGYKWTNLIYLLGATALLALLVGDERDGLLAWMSGTAFAVCLFFLPERFWYEMFRQGANDVFPVLLILASLLWLRAGKPFWAGLFAGLSFSAKFSPAAFLIIPLLRRDLRRSLILGTALGLTPLFPFLVWDPLGLINNAFVVRFILRFDSTSLYSVTPSALHWVFPATLGLALVASFTFNFKRPATVENVILSFTFLLIVAEVTFKEIHENHLIWFIPLFALILERTRHRLFVTVQGF